MATEPGSAWELCAAAGEALAEAGFRTGEFTSPGELFARARARAERDGDRKAEATAIGGLGMTVHYRTIARLVSDLPPDGADVAEEEALMRQALAISKETGEAAGTARALFGMGLVFQVLHRDWAAAMPYFWQAYGLAEALSDSGDLYGRSEIHRHLGFYYLYSDVRPHEAVRQQGHSLAWRERLGDPRRIPSALVALSEAELAAGNPARAVELAGRAVRLARDAGLLPWRVADAGECLQRAEAALAAAG